MPFDQKLWNANACGFRCLIEVAQRKLNRVITPEHILKTYGHLSNGEWTSKPGSADDLLLFYAIRDLKITNQANTYIEPQKLMDELPYSLAILGHTEKQLHEDGRLTPWYHVMIIEPESAGFKYWSPAIDKEGNATVDEDFLPWEVWPVMMMRGTVLYKPYTPPPGSS